jgi:diguanylate cyclase (GGDEF)-like protein
MNIEARIRELLRQLPRARLSPDARARLEAADAGSPEALRTGLRAAVGDLLRRGELVRVNADGGGAGRGALFLVRGSSQLLDLSVLSPGRPAAAGDGERPASGAGSTFPGPDAADAGTAWPGGDGDAPAFACRDAPDSSPDVAAVLAALEQAQDLAIGDPRAEEPAVMVSRILMLLRDYVPAVHLRAQLLPGAGGGTETAAGVLPPPTPEQTPFWLRCRAPGQSLWIPDRAELPPALQRQLPDGSAPATAAVPLWSPAADGREVGLLYVTAAMDDRVALTRLARRLSAFVTRRWRCQQDVNRRVLTDSLTGIHNRAFFDSHFPLELERARRGDYPLTLAIGDLDHFKAINDTYHHQGGDRVLQGVARQLQEALRRIDSVCRIGGEEFAFILPYTSQEQTHEVLGRLVGRPLRVALPAEWGGGAVAVTMSYGAVTFPTAGSSAGELHRKADSMLYRAKELGRNRCCIWVGPGRHQELLPSQSRAADH